MSVFFGLDVALERMAEEGLESIQTRHRRIGDMTRREVKALGLELFCEDESFASDTVTAVKAPEGIDVTALRNMMEDEHNTVLAGGQAKLAGKIFRIGHLGLVDEEDIRLTMDGLAQSLDKLGFKRPN
jgi:aspartate aminotransferase-like enzyme